MAFAIKTTLVNVQNYLKSLGDFPMAQVGDFLIPPNQPLAAAIFMRSVRVYAVTAGGGIREVHTVTVRIARNTLNVPTEDIENNMADVVSRFLSKLLADSDLGTTVLSLDVAGMAGSPISTEWGFLELKTLWFRIVDIHLPILVDDSATSTP